jgi:DNA-binding MarR family transcriptional regulator
VWLQLEDQVPPQPGGQPLPVLLPPLDDGPHLNYTGQWAIFATLTLVIYVVLVVRTAQRGGDGPGTARRASTGRGSDPEVLAMCAVRLAPLRAPDAMAAIVGLPTATLTDHLDRLVAAGFARHHTTEPPGWTLTPAGHAELERRLAEELDAAGLRPRVRECYARFVPLNERLLAIITDWQVRAAPDGTLELNDHADPTADAAVIARLGALDDEAGPLCDDLGVALARFGGYRHRLATARRRLESGETVYLDGMQVDSYHLVWFELHEHLLASLGIPRGGDEPAAVVPGGAVTQGE